MACSMSFNSNKLKYEMIELSETALSTIGRSCRQFMHLVNSVDKTGAIEETAIQLAFFDFFVATYAAQNH